MPLFGTIDGILSPEKSAAIIGAVLERFPVDIPKEYDTSGLEDITIWIRGRMDQKKHSQISDTILRYDIQPPEGLQPDDLTRIKGIGEALAAQLKKNDIRSFEQIANWSNQDIIEFSERSGISERRIFSNDWVAQAKALIGDDTSQTETDADGGSEATDITDETRILDDLAAKEDELGRKSVAVSIARNVRAVWDRHQKAERPFIVHLSGRWGSGKSSILNFLRTELKSTENGQKEWAVVDFNAWRHNEGSEVWWSLLNAVVDSAPKEARGSQKWRLPRRHWLWRFFTGTWPAFFAVLTLVGLLWLIFISDLGGSGTTTTITDTKAATEAQSGEITFPDETTGPAELTRKEVTTSTETDRPIATIVKDFGGLITLALAIAGLFSQFWSRRNQTAEAIQALDSDPSSRLHDQYKNVIFRMGRPVAIFIDDLDRCDADYVVKLLQAIQNIYADVPVLYVVAADRDWIVSSYSQVYKDFNDDLSEPGRPLGHLFVEKIFQLSVNVPDLGTTTQRRFLEKKLGYNPSEPENVTAKEFDEGVVTELRAEAKRKRGSPEELADFIEEKKATDVEFLARSIAFEEITTGEAERELTHRLLAYTDLLDPNPRAIKRLVNAYAFRFGFMLLTGETDTMEKLPRWCILEQRFPYAAKALSERPFLMKDEEWARPPADGEEDRFPNHALIRDILGDLTQEDVETLRRFG